MRRRWVQKRRSGQSGFALAEALVSLTIAAMTLALLTSATWGLRQTTLQPTELQQEATDWLTARRVLQSWAASASLAGRDMTEGRFFGSPTQMRMILDDGTSGDSRPMMVGLTITQEDGLYRLVASRNFDVRDVRLAGDNAQTSTMIVSESPLSLVYRAGATSVARQGVWTYEPRPEQGLPFAVAIEQGAERMIVAQMPTTISAICVARLGPAGLEDRDCELR
ncbi:hypothetical protein [Yoonia sp. BS5-3]|uniref:Prepilin-type N-terminal cleavage/methylation domain-containing protein n=1 Tax=Yoonia phaeophyticola TaxID=3137369 RepID=A0ABZ2VAK8_9RHOB